MPIRRALISVADKTGLEELVAGLQRLEPEVEILSTGGTARALRDLGAPVTEIADWTGFPEAFGGRLKTLHPRLHGGILYRREAEGEEARRLGIEPIDLVAVNLYPFARALTESAPEPVLVEQIDIGGVALLRAAAKNSSEVVVLCHPEDYRPVLEEAASGEVSPATRRRLRARAFAHTAAYDSLIAAALATEEFPEVMALPLVRRQELRYGENPHQRAALYCLPGRAGGLAGFRQLQGKALSYTNILDLVAAWNAATRLAGIGQARGGSGPRGDGRTPACAVVKHASPCGLALGDKAFRAAWACDPLSAFGSAVALSHPADAEVAEAIVEGRFVEVLAAPGFHPQARRILAARPNLRLLEVPAEDRSGPFDGVYAGAAGLVLAQTPDRADLEEFRSATRVPFPEEALPLARFAVTAAACVKSNAIVVAREESPGCWVTVGIGGGQPSRVDAVRLALERARRHHPDLSGCVLASDAFFPFPDSVEEAARAGVRLVVQPGGSRRDPEVLEACDRLGVAMALTGVRHFLH